MPESGPGLVLIRFGKYQYKGNLPFAKLIHKFEIVGLRRMAAVDQYKQTDQVLSFRIRSYSPSCYGLSEKLWHIRAREDRQYSISFYPMKAPQND